MQIENRKLKNGKESIQAALQHGGAFTAASQVSAKCASKVHNAGYARMQSGHTPGPTPICSFQFAICNLQSLFLLKAAS
jgi:hypothetical protein